MDKRCYRDGLVSIWMGIPGAVSFSQALPGAESPLPFPSVCQLNLQDVSERRKARLLFFLYLNAKGNFPRAMRGRAATQRLANRSAGMSGDSERAAKIWGRRVLPVAGRERPPGNTRCCKLFAGSAGREIASSRSVGLST